MDDKLPAPCEACRGSGLRHGVACGECHGKGYRLFVNGSVKQQVRSDGNPPVKRETLVIPAECLAVLRHMTMGAALFL